jgi:hypothetical protein
MQNEIVESKSVVKEEKRERQRRREARSVLFNKLSTVDSGYSRM